MEQDKDNSSESVDEDFPWHLGLYDAHCHPTDTMSSIEEVPDMKARVLTIMATRSQDQHLMSEVARRMGMKTKDLHDTAQCRILPSFGWHPWFSHQIADDLGDDRLLSKLNHYKAVLVPAPDDDFISDLPDPRPLSDYLQETKTYLGEHPLALVGEIGLDKAFRLPIPSAEPKYDEPGLTPGGREGRRLSPYRVDANHQRKILKAQLRLAGELGRAASVHIVGAHGLVFQILQESWKGHEKPFMSNRERKRRESAARAHDFDDSDSDSDDSGNRDDVGQKIKMEMHIPKPASEASQVGMESESKPYPPRICLHSFTGPPETVKQYFHPSVPADIYMSFSQAINFSVPNTDKAVQVIKAVPQDRILVESDLHCAGKQMDDLLEEMARSICRIRGWGLQEGVARLAQNWRSFAFG